jgi:hypothetical protein
MFSVWTRHYLLTFLFQAAFALCKVSPACCSTALLSVKSVLLAVLKLLLYVLSLLLAFHPLHTRFQSSPARCSAVIAALQPLHSCFSYSLFICFCSLHCKPPLLLAVQQLLLSVQSLLLAFQPLLQYTRFQSSPARFSSVIAF